MRRLLPLLILAPLMATAPTRRTVLAMGTSLTWEGMAPASAQARAFAAVEALEARCSTWRPESLWSRLNAGDAVALPAEDLDLLRRVAALSRQVDGAFDPVLGRLIEAWGLRRGGLTPDPEALGAARRASGLDLLELGAEGARLRNGAWLEEGGFLKGRALDLAAAELRAGGARSGLLDFGGQLLAWGPARRVALADPADRQRPRLTIRLRNASLSTSGTSERGRHILDPRTGQPCPAWGAVAVLRPSGLEADVLSTALYVLGPDRGLAWAEAHGVAAVFLPLEGPVRMSSAFRSHHPRRP